MEIQCAQHNQNNLEKEQNEGFIFPDFKTYHETAVIVTKLKSLKINEFLTRVLPQFIKRIVFKKQW
jgi:hypothetical protein